MAIFKGKHLCRSVFFDKFAGLCKFMKKTLQHRYLPVNIAEFLLEKLFYGTSSAGLLNLSWSGLCYIETSLIICFANQWTSRQSLDSIW